MGMLWGGFGVFDVRVGLYGDAMGWPLGTLMSPGVSMDINGDVMG